MRDVCGGISQSLAGRMVKMLIFHEYFKTHVSLQVPDVIRIVRFLNNFLIRI